VYHVKDGGKRLENQCLPDVREDNTRWIAGGFGTWSCDQCEEREAALRGSLDNEEDTANERVPSSWWLSDSEP
jgi:hypothetical protein